MSIHLTYSRNGKEHDLILQDGKENPKNTIALNGRDYTVLGANTEEHQEAEFLIERIKELALKKEVNSKSIRTNLIEWGVEEDSLKCPLLETTEKVAKIISKPLSEKSVQEKMQDIINKAVKEEGLSGSIIVAQKGISLLKQKDYGVAASLKTSEMEVTYRWASVTKTITAVAILQLAEKGIIDLDVPITKYFVEYEDAEKYPGFQEVTARQLLCHQSLAPDHDDHMDTLVNKEISEIKDPTKKVALEKIRRKYEYELQKISDPIKRRQYAFRNYPQSLRKIKNKIEDEYYSKAHAPTAMIDTIMTLPLKQVPHGYNNFAFTLLALLVEKTTGSYDGYIKENIFKVAGMTTARVATNEQDKVMAEAPPPLDNASVRFGSGNINGSIEDLYRFDRALHQEKILLKKESLITEMNDQYLGWDKEAPPEISGKRMVGKTGAFAEGNFTSYQYFPDTDTTIIILSHSSSRLAKRHVAEIGEELAEVLFSK